MSTVEVELEPLKRLTRDLKNASVRLTTKEARYLVDLYYQMQANRIVAGNQTKALEKTQEPHETIVWVAGQANILENEIKKALDVYSASLPMGQWARSIVGIGPVIAAGLLAHIDVTKVKSAAGIWRFAGLDPTVVWKKKQKRPWNASLKLLCFKIGDSFIKQQNHPDDIYGHLYAIRRAKENDKNENGLLKSEADRMLATKTWDKKTVSYGKYVNGELPDAQLLRRSARWAVKVFLSHYYEVAYHYEHGQFPARPFAFDILGHDPNHIIPIPNNPFEGED
jgi:hypothetical protein